MTSIESLPVELIQAIALSLDTYSDLAAFAAVSRWFHINVNEILYARAATSARQRVLFWAAEYGRLSTMKLALDAGADSNHGWSSMMRWSRQEELGRASAPCPSEPSQPIQWNRFKGPRLWGEMERVGSLETYEMTDRKPVRGRGCIGCIDLGTADNSEAHVECEQCRFDNDIWSQAASASHGVTTGMSGTSTYEGDSLIQRIALGPGFYTPLHLAARGGHDDLVELLLDRGARFDTFCREICPCEDVYQRLVRSMDDDTHDLLPLPNAYTPLHLALCHGHTTTARLLLQKGASPIQLGRDLNTTALHLAAGLGDVSLINFLLNSRFEMTTPPPSHFVSPSIRRVVENNGFENMVDVTDCYGVTPFQYAYIYGQWEAAELLLARGANIDHRAPGFNNLLETQGGGATALGDAILTSRMADATRLLDLGATPSAMFHETSLFSPVHYCCQIYEVRHYENPKFHVDREYQSSQEMRVKLLERLSPSDEHINLRAEGKTPLTLAVLNGFRLLAKWLLDNGAEIETTLSRQALVFTAPGDDVIVSSLIWASQQPHPSTDIISLLLEYGADTSVKGGPKSMTSLDSICFINGAYQGSHEQMDLIRLFLARERASKPLETFREIALRALSTALRALNIKVCRIIVGEFLPVLPLPPPSPRLLSSSSFSLSSPFPAIEDYPEDTGNTLHIPPLPSGSYYPSPPLLGHHKGGGGKKDAAEGEEENERFKKEEEREKAPQLLGEEAAAVAEEEKTNRGSPAYNPLNTLPFDSKLTPLDLARLFHVLARGPTLDTIRVADPSFHPCLGFVLLELDGESRFVGRSSACAAAAKQISTWWEGLPDHPEGMAERLWELEGRGMMPWGTAEERGGVKGGLVYESSSVVGGVGEGGRERGRRRREGEDGRDGRGRREEEEGGGSDINDMRRNGTPRLGTLARVTGTSLSDWI